MLRKLSLLLALLLLASGCSRKTEVVVLYAASLRRVVADAAAEYQRANPGVRLRLEPSGSQVAIRKVTEQKLPADLVVVSDASLLDRMMLPGHAAWNLVFATNEIVLAHQQHSRFTDEVGPGNWSEVLGRPGVRVGRVNPDTAPIGYHTLLAWRLAETHLQVPGLAARLTEASSKERMGADETELLGMLEAKAVDFAFLYRSTAEDHHLKFVELPAEMNLGSLELGPRYAQASVEVKMKEGPVVLNGQPISYGATIPSIARNPDEGERFLLFLVGERGRALQRTAGIKAKTPPLVRGALPDKWKDLAR